MHSRAIEPKMVLAKQTPGKRNQSYHVDTAQHLINVK